MKELLIILIMMYLVGCSRPGGMVQVVQDKYPEADVRPIPRHAYMFIVRQPNGDILLIKCGNATDDEITYSNTLLKGAKK